MASSADSTSAVLISDSEKKFMLEGIEADCRSDGRKPKDFRTYYLEEGPIQLSNGSSRLIDCNNTLLILCSVKAELVKPSKNRPGSGSIELAIDEHASSNNKRLRETRAALQQRLHWLNLEKLCVLEGHAAWRLYIDLYVLKGTSWLDAASHCIRHALSTTHLPAIAIAEDASAEGKNVLDRLLVNGDIAMARPVLESIEDSPILVTVTVIQTNNDNCLPVLLLDATAEEESVSIASVHVAIHKQNIVSAVWKSGKGSLALSLLPSCVQTAIDAAPVATRQHKIIKAEGDTGGHVKLLEGTILIQ